MPKWLHERAEHLLARNPDMKKSTAFALATQQSHALGKSPRGYGTAEGKHVAKAKYDTPSDDTRKANPGNLESPKMAAAACEAFGLMEKDGGIGSLLGGFLPSASKVAPSTGALKAQGVLSQMQKGRSFGGAAVDPFVRMRQQQAQLGKLAGVSSVAGRLLPPQ